ncbi:pimeloyl-ACP methyl ester carboxylesterase [Natranaerovirga hydrolytica]|uniref:Pimeloyl-ACP methyl ester carboxylesterase n=1 Tax=Natranaerovirga hydrolytica TaxID=680378 RepID=A0A4R1MN14_9FIRM|nr:alpha/beta hydrolase [Natranaerovirga hydrolytica]TCK92684.1 pimeloyl-ACP methyl ester carboxylesterase [Natranaerovirga hydrolytica]
MPYIFIHGLGQNSSSWDKMLSLMTQPIPTVCPDLFGLLNNKEVTYENLYDAFAEYCNNISGPLNLCGLSLGGVLALNYAIDYPTKVQSLVLISAQYKMPKKLLKFQNIIFRLMPEVAFKSMGIKKRDCIGLISSMIDLDFTKKLNNISCHTLIICGSKDGANKKAAKKLAHNISKSQLHLIKKTGHEVNIEAPEKLVSILRL